MTHLVHKVSLPATKVIKSKPAEAATRNSIEKPKPVKLRATRGAEAEVKVSAAVRKSRAASCPRCPPRGRCDAATGAQRAASNSKTTCERRSRSSAPRPTANCSKTNLKETGSVKHAAAVSLRSRESGACPGQREPRSVTAEPKYPNQSHKAFTVIPPNPKKRREIQRKAEAELAALEELRLSRAMAYVSINPSSVGGCMSLEEVRLKQQQEMMRARRKQQQMKKQEMEQTPVLTS